MEIIVQVQSHHRSGTDALDGIHSYVNVGPGATGWGVFQPYDIVVESRHTVLKTCVPAMFVEFNKASIMTMHRTVSTIPILFMR
jgi:hypothetical protein